MGLIPTREVQLLLGCHRNTVFNLIRRGKLTMHRDYRGYGCFAVDEVLALREERKKIRKSQNDPFEGREDLSYGTH